MRFKLPLFLVALTYLPMMTSSPVKAEGIQVAPNYIYEISIVRTPTPENDIFNIRLASSASMTGCFDSKPADVEKIDAGAVIYVKLEEGEINMNKKPSYGHFECQLNSGAAYTDIPFNKDDLIENGTHKIEIKSENVGKLFDIEIKSDDSKITLNSELKTPIRLPEDEKKKKMHYWFYPDNTVILSVPGMHRNSDSMKKLKSFALGRGLTPMQDALDGFPTPKSDAKEIFYVDNRKLLADVQDGDKPIIVGNISKIEEFQGPKGPYQKARKVSVFARALNVHD